MPSTFFDNWTDGQSVRRGRIVRGRIVPSRRQTINYTVTTRLDVSHNFNNCGRQGQLPHRSGHGSAGPKMEKGEWRCKSYYVHVCQNVAKQYSLPLTSGIWLSKAWYPACPSLLLRRRAMLRFFPLMYVKNCEERHTFTVLLGIKNLAN